jgi:hypothetical protein
MHPVTEILIAKSKTVAFRGKEPVRTSEEVIQQVICFKCVCYCIMYEGEDILEVIYITAWQWE